MPKIRIKKKHYNENHPKHKVCLMMQCKIQLQISMHPSRSLNKINYRHQIHDKLPPQKKKDTQAKDLYFAITFA
jgi:hypothetical protein